MLTEDKINELVGKGFKRWTKGNHDRLYISASDLGLECEYYKNGNIRSAYFNGTGISNCEARRMKGSRTYIDIKTGLVYGDNDDLKKAASELSGIGGAE